MDNKSCHYHHYLNYFSNICVIYNRLSRWLTGKGYACQCRRYRIFGFNPWVGKITWRRKWQPTPVFLHGKSHGRRSLVGYGSQESYTIQQLNHQQRYQLDLLCKIVRVTMVSTVAKIGRAYLEALKTLLASLIAQLVKNLPAMQEIPGRSLGWEDPLEKG